MATTSTSTVESAILAEENGDDFAWEAYFARTGAMAVDNGAFYHVERSQQRLTNSSDLSHLDLQKPKTVADSIQIGRYVDVQDERDPRTVWPAEILENFGGRLLLKYLCLQDAGAPFWEFYLSERVHPAGVCDTDLGKELELQYALPSTCSNPGFVPSAELVQELADQAKAYTLDGALFKDRPVPKPHQMEVGMWLEAIDPLGGSIFYPAVVVAVLNKYYFVISHDATMINENSNLASETDPLFRTCHASSPGLFPIGFTGRLGLSFAAPEGFDWAAYLRKNSGRMAHEKCFQKLESDDRLIPGRRLEAVNPSAPHQICAATVIRRVENLIWLHIDSSSHLTQTHVVDCRSTKLFPCGWCAAYGYSLKAPYEHNLKDFKTAQAKLANTVRKYSPQEDFLWTTSNAHKAFMPDFFIPNSGCSWSPTIYISARCFAGPHVDRLRLSTKPRQVGPGPMISVLKTVAESVLSAAFRPRDLLADLQPVSNSENPMMQLVEVKAKYLTKHWKGSIHICKDPQQIPEWCRQLCIRLEACPGLLGFKPYLNDKCPFECNRTPKVKRLGIAKPLSCNAAKRLKTRLAVQQKRFEAAEGNAQQHSDQPAAIPKRKRTRQIPNSHSSHPTKDIDVNRPVTRAAKLATSLDRNGNRRSERTRSNNRPIRLSSIEDDDSDNESGSSTVEYYLESGCESVASDINHTIGIHQSSKGYCGICENCLASSSVRSAHQNGDINTDRPCGCYFRIAAPSVTIPPVESDPLTWTPDQLHTWLRNTVINIGTADQLRDELIDGQAFMMMDIRDVQEYMKLKLGPALKVCSVIKELKIVYLKKYAASTQATKEDEAKCSSEKCNGSHSCDLVRETSTQSK